MFVHAGELRRSELHSTLNSSLTVVCWSWICRLGSIEMGAFGPIGTLPLDQKSGSPESQPGLLPDIYKPPLRRVGNYPVPSRGVNCPWNVRRGGSSPSAQEDRALRRRQTDRNLVGYPGGGVTFSVPEYLRACADRRVAHVSMGDGEPFW